jgi:hypothetical protein
MSGMMWRRSNLPIALFALLGLIVIPIYPHAVSPNEYSRWALDVALVDFRTVEVSPVLKATGIPIMDLATKDGRFYTNKAPGGSLLTLPVYAIARAIVGPPSTATMRATLNAMRIAGATVPAILAALWLAAVARRLGCDETRVTTAVTCLLFATPLLAYGLLFFAHALSAFTVFGAWALLFHKDRNRWRELAAGALIGLAVLCEYPNAVPAAALILCAFPIIGGRGILRVILGGLPFALILGIYNQAAFGSPFSLSSAHEVDAPIRALAARGLFGVGLPSPNYLARLLADPSRGLLVVSPVLLMALAGLGRARRAMPLPAFIALLVIPVVILLTFAGYPNWFGGRTVGARYLVPALPFLALLIAFAAETIVEKILLGASVAAVAVMSLVFPFIPVGYNAPWYSFSWPLLREGCVVPNLFHLISSPLAIAVPFTIVAAALVVSMRPRHLAFALAGAVLWFAAGWLGEQRTPSPPHLIALTEEVHFERPGVIARRFRPDHPFTIHLQQIADAQKRLPPPSWPSPRREP